MSTVDIPNEARLKYIERRRTDLENCRKALLQDDFKTLAQVGHQIKGNAITFGFEELGILATELESSALEKDKKQLGLILDRFGLYITKT
jgi:HPt (histidine-containing phosphotransfer) domain-containing protein